jgi:flagellar hook protein FlgE
MRAMYAAVSGLDLEQTAMDVIGNNIANVTTPGFKQSGSLFEEMFAQTLQGASAPTQTTGGSNPAQVGLGVQLAGITPDMSQGSLQTTGVNTDLAITGGGGSMFVLDAGGGQNLYTRLGSFSVDANGNLVNAQGLRVMGWMATNGTFGSENASTLTDIQIPEGATKQPTPTANVSFGGNLDSTSVSSATTSVSVYDSLGNTTTVTLTFTPAGSNSWNWTATIPASGGGTTNVGSGSVSFTTAGVYQSGSGTISFTPPGAAALNITPNFSQMTQYAQASDPTPLSQDGSGAGSMTGFTIDQNGVITAEYSNGQTQPIAQVALAAFSNPSGLTQVGSSNFAQSNNSGLPQVGAANSGGRGGLQSGALEQSNVDLASQFTDMITAERAFQSDAQVIQTANTMLQVLTTLKQPS